MSEWDQHIAICMEKPTTKWIQHLIQNWIPNIKKNYIRVIFLCAVFFSLHLDLFFSFLLVSLSNLFFSAPFCRSHSATWISCTLNLLPILLYSSIQLMKHKWKWLRKREKQKELKCIDVNWVYAMQNLARRTNKNEWWLSKQNMVIECIAFTTHIYIIREAQRI